MQGGWRRSPQGKALASIKQRGQGIAMPFNWSKKWQKMTILEVEEQLRAEGASEHLIARELKWFAEIIEKEENIRKELKERRRSTSSIEETEEYSDYTDALSRRVDRYAEITTRKETELGSGRDRVQYVQGKPDEELGDTEGDIS